MENIGLIISVPEELVCSGFERPFSEEEKDILIKAIGNSTPLHKGGIKMEQSNVRIDVARRILHIAGLSPIHGDVVMNLIGEEAYQNVMRTLSENDDKIQILNNIKNDILRLHDLPFNRVNVLKIIDSYIYMKIYMKVRKVR